MRNHSVVSEFIVLGLSADPQIQALLFVLFFVIYILTLMGNLMLLLVVRVDSQLHNPMYFFLGQLSFLDLCHSLSLCPSCWRTSCLRRKPSHSRAAWLRSSLCLPLEALNPAYLLSWPMTAMLPSVLLCCTARWWTESCVWGSWGLAFTDALINILVALNLDFCEAQNIHHFGCELPSLYPLSCSDVSASFTALLCSSLLHFFGNFLLIFVSYVCIFFTILSISSTEGRSKAFSTCSSHLTAVSFFYGSGLLRYLMPNSGSTQEFICSLQYSVITPMLNPLSYSLKNKEVKAAVRKMLRKCS